MIIELVDNKGFSLRTKILSFRPVLYWAIKEGDGLGMFDITQEITLNSAFTKKLTFYFHKKVKNVFYYKERIF